MSVIITIIIVMFLVLILYMWNSLTNIEIKRKITCMLIGMAIIYVFTFIIFNISKFGIEYSNKNAMIATRRILVIVFSILNSYIILPFIFKRLNQLSEKKIEKQKIKNSLIIIFTIIVILSIFETIYLKRMQQNMLEAYYKTKIQTENN